MGKIFIKFLNSSPIGYGVEFTQIQKVINSIPGQTYITRIEDCIFSTLAGKNFKLEAENVNFSGGTEIVPKYKKGSSVVNGSIVYYDVFDGIDIVDPPAISILSTSHITNGSNSSTIPSNGFTYHTGNGTYTIPAGQTAYVSYGAGGGGGGSYKPIFKTPKPQDSPSIESNKCTCGAESVKGAHSNWCDKK